MTTSLGLLARYRETIRPLRRQLLAVTPGLLHSRRSRLAPRRSSSPDSQWFWDHYDWAVGEILDFCQPRGLDLAGKTIADIGAGDGLIPLGLCRRVQARRLVAFDVVPTNVEILREKCRAEGVDDSLPSELEFVRSEPAALPAQDGTFDFVYSWSAFEHISDPVAVLREIRRILRPHGQFFLQLWPFFRSAKGSHLSDWFPDDFHHLAETETTILSELYSSAIRAPEWRSYMAREFQNLNRISLDELQRAILAAGLTVSWVELLSTPTRLTPSLGRYSWSDLAVGGIKLLATRDDCDVTDLAKGA